MNSKSYDLFILERELIGEGSRCKVYKWKNKAYKCFDLDYPASWIELEKQIQNEICKSNLNVTKFYKTGFPNTIKMDLVDGKTTSEMIKTYGKVKVIKDFMDYFDILHTVKGLNLVDNSKFLVKQIKKSPVLNAQKEKALNYLKEINIKVKEEKVLCHNDYHFLNTLYKDDKIYVVDFIDARNGKPILDYARTYVIMYHYAPGFKRRYYKEVLNRRHYNQELFNKAIYVSTINRLEENDNKRSRQLLSLLDNNINNL